MVSRLRPQSQGQQCCISVSLFIRLINCRARVLLCWNQSIRSSSYLPNVVAKSVGCLQRYLFVCVFLYGCVCQHDNFRTSKHRMMKLGGRCIVQKYRPSSNLGVIAPGCAPHKNAAFGYDVGKISAVVVLAVVSEMTDSLRHLLPCRQLRSITASGICIIYWLASPMMIFEDRSSY